jgi:hypothetical protein
MFTPPLEPTPTDSDFFIEPLLILVRYKRKAATGAVCAFGNYILTRISQLLKELSQDGGRTLFSGNLRASLFNDDLSKEPTFSKIHLAKQYL